MAASTSMTWSLITVTFNNAATLKEYWSNLEWPHDVEWIVVDNASNDDSVQVAESLGATVISMSKNRGFGAANNVGFDQALGRYVAFVNPDVTVNFESLEVLSDLIETQDAIVAPQLVNPDRTLQANGRGLPYLRHKVQHRLSPETLDDSYRLFAADGEDREVDWFIGAAVAGKRETFLRLGPWDPRFFLYYEDADICLRATAAGYKCIVTGRATWVHGWKRETATFKFQPWKREIASMTKFYLRYPALLSPIPRKSRNEPKAIKQKVNHASRI